MNLDRNGVLARDQDGRRHAADVVDGAVIRGTGINNDGRGEGPMTPRREGQLAALASAYKDCGLSPDTIGYVEAHGTATGVGDVVEVAEQVEAVVLDELTRAVSSLPGLRPDAPPLVRFRAFGEWGLEWRAYVEILSSQDRFFLRHELMKRLHRRDRKSVV